MGIFKAYDVRGVYGDEIDDSIMEKIGRAFADFIDGNLIAVGRDMRISSPSLFKAFCRGVVMQGKKAIDFGMTSTPMSYFACCHLKVDGCAMITASHNPKQYNGVKFTKGNAVPVSGDTGIKEIESAVLDNKFKKAAKKGEIEKAEIKNDYKKFLKAFLKDVKGLKVVVDGSNGMGSQDFSLVNDYLDCDTKIINFDIDGNFPSHDPNPMNNGAADMLISEVKKMHADLGIIFDGDADRVFFVDEKGSIVPSDYVTALISEELLKYHKNSEILYDLRSSWIVPERIKAMGGIPKMSRVGHSFIKELMRKDKALFAGELSGHFYFKDAHYTDSGIIAAICILNLLSSRKETFSKLVSPLEKYFASGEINFEVKDKDRVMKCIEEKYSDGKISWLDGIKVEYDDWWFNVRASNTEPLLRLNMEARTKLLLKEKKEEILSVMT